MASVRSEMALSARTEVRDLTAKKENRMREQESQDSPGQDSRDISEVSTTHVRKCLGHPQTICISAPQNCTPLDQNGERVQLFSLSPSSSDSSSQSVWYIKKGCGRSSLLNIKQQSHPKSHSSLGLRFSPQFSLQQRNLRQRASQPNNQAMYELNNGINATPKDNPKIPKHRHRKLRVHKSWVNAKIHTKV